MRPYFLYGNRVKCVLCGWSFRRFLPSGILEREFWRGTEGREIRKLPHVTICNAKCPKCGSSERQRLFFIYMKLCMNDINTINIYIYILKNIYSIILIYIY